ncbi:hypothetical protein NLX86_19080 [Streptomyces sp. A3M-1-3]|uniref:hypothetical protein n=1 Tax=Streptomyces sp. A3M-1-3 TaxID=2962044 RepID=UPI0020B6EC30|nr:hypothetical protein [Streptomyces sp. A3M-1-3]MCP3820123.1 hypothetical protein [Streptomyces sp. A3M-1-3]
MSITIPWLAPGRHRLSPAQLRAENATLLNRQAAADDYFARLTEDRDDVYRCWQKAAAARDTAEELAAGYAQQLAAQTAELLELRAFRHNTLAVSAPIGQRDIDPDDQPTQPIPVPLWEAHGIGPVHAVTDPGQTTWGARNQQQGVA